MEESHIRIIPNIGNKQRKNVFEENLAEDAETQSRAFRKKGIDVLNIETQKTHEETSEKADGGNISWLIIALVVVVIILLIAIVYYVLAKNSNAPLYKVVEPGIHPTRTHFPHQSVPLAQQTQTQPAHPSHFVQPHPEQHTQKYTNTQKTQRPEQPAENRHKLYVDPTEEELDNALERASNKRTKDTDELNEPVVLLEENNIEFIKMDEHIKNLIYNDELEDGNDMGFGKLTPEEIENFHESVINSS